jgi:hypothetical protein
VFPSQFEYASGSGSLERSGCCPRIIRIGILLAAYSLSRNPMGKRLRVVTGEHPSLVVPRHPPHSTGVTPPLRCSNTKIGLKLPRYGVVSLSVDRYHEQLC